MSRQPLLSIVVPIYNGEAYVDQLFDVFEAQTDKDFEVIFVDDGSTDHTLRALMKRANHSTFSTRVESIPPKGVSAARNHGITKATGKYLSFVDADDRIVKTYVERLRSAAATGFFDVFVFQSKRVGPEGPFPSLPYLREKETDSLSMLKSLAVNPTRYGVYNLFLDREFVNRHFFRFTEGRAYYEDYDLLLRIFSVAEHICITESELYFYILQEGSAVATYSLKRYEDLELLEGLVPFLNEHCPDFVETYVTQFLPRIWWSLLWQGCLAFSTSDVKKLIRAGDFDRRLEPLKHHPDKKVRLSTRLYYTSHSAFIRAVKTVGKRRSRVEKTDVAPFLSYLERREDDLA